MSLAGIVEKLNSGAVAELPAREQQKLLLEVRQSVTASYANFGEEYLPAYRSHFPDIPGIINPITAKVREILQADHLKVLDLGCGPGEDLAYWQSLKGVEAEGLELSDFFMDICRRKMVENTLAAGSVTQGVAEKMPFEGDRFNLIYARNSMLHVPYIKGSQMGMAAVFSEAKRVLKKGGIFYLHLRGGDHCYIQKDAKRFFQLYCPEMIEKLAAQNAMKVLSMEPYRREEFPVEIWRNWLEVYIRL